MIQEEFEIKDNVLVKYHEQKGKTKVVIPDGVIEIKNGAFSNCINLIDITIPNSVKEIGMHCFYNCSNLRNIKLPDKLEFIWNGLFHGCTSLSTITLPKSVTYIGDQAFDGCENLTSIVIPDTVTDIRDFAFWDCKKLVEITLPNSISNMGCMVFDGCENLKKINISSYKTFYLIDRNLDAIALNTIIKNKQQFSEEEITKFKEYIIENKMYLIKHILKNDDLLDLLNYMLNNMGLVYTKEEVDSILNEVINLNEVNNKAEITGMFLEYKKRNFGFENPLDEFDLGELNNEEINLNNDEDENKKGRLI